MKLTHLNPGEGAAWGGLLRTHAELTARMNRELVDACDITLATYDVLRHIALADNGRIRLAALADRVMLTRGGLTPVVQRLENEGLLERETDAHDRRGAWVQLTSTGRKQLARAHGRHVRSIREHFLDHLDHEQLETLADIWQALRTR